MRSQWNKLLTVSCTNAISLFNVIMIITARAAWVLWREKKPAAHTVICFFEKWKEVIEENWWPPVCGQLFQASRLKSCLEPTGGDVTMQGADRELGMNGRIETEERAAEVNSRGGSRSLEPHQCRSRGVQSAVSESPSASATPAHFLWRGRAAR